MTQIHQQPRSHFYRLIALPFIVVSLTIVGIIFIIAFSWATIIISPKSEYQQRSEQFVVAKERGDEQGVIQGNLLEYELSAIGTFTPSSQGSFPQRASGNITVINSTSSNQQLITTTRFLTSTGKLFRSTQSVVVPHNGSLRVSVIADEVGEVTDLSSEHFVIPGLWPGLQERIYGAGFTQNDSGATEVRIISQSDIDAAEKSLISKIEEQLDLRIQSDGMTDTFRPTRMGEVHSMTILSRTFSHGIGEQTDSYDASITARMRVILFDEAQAKDYLKFVFSKELSSGRELLPLDMSTLKINLISQDDWPHKAVVMAQGTVGMSLAENYLALERKLLTGKSPSDVRSYYERALGVSDTEVRLYPFWVTRMPLLYDHISVIIKR